MQRASLDRLVIHAVQALVVFLCSGIPTWDSIEEGRKAAANSFAREIERTHFHKAYVPDFLDPSGARTETGCFFASTFSTNLAESSHSFAVVSRVQAQEVLNELHILPQDLRQAETLEKAARALGADVVLIGSGTISSTDAMLFLSLRDPASGVEIHSMNYHEKLDNKFEGYFPTTQSDASGVYYFPGLDGVSQPKCKHCPDPEYTDEDRGKRIQGKVLLSLSLDEKGIITNARVVTNPNDSLTKSALSALKKWRMEPSHDSEGKAVPVRVIIEIGFRLLD